MTIGFRRMVTEAVRDPLVIEHEPDHDGGSTAVVAIFLIALSVILVVLLYGLLWGHWFNFGGTVNVVTSVGSGGAFPSQNASASP